MRQSMATFSLTSTEATLIECDQCNRRGYVCGLCPKRYDTANLEAKLRSLEDEHTDGLLFTILKRLLSDVVHYAYDQITVQSQRPSQRLKRLIYFLLFNARLLRSHSCWSRCADLSSSFPTSCTLLRAIPALFRIACVVASAKQLSYCMVDAMQRAAFIVHLMILYWSVAYCELTKNSDRLEILFPRLLSIGAKERLKDSETAPRLFKRVPPELSPEARAAIEAFTISVILKDDLPKRMLQQAAETNRNIYVSVANTLDTADSAQ